MWAPTYSCIPLCTCLYYSAAILDTNSSNSRNNQVILWNYFTALRSYTPNLGIKFRLKGLDCVFLLLTSAIYLLPSVQSRVRNCVKRCIKSWVQSWAWTGTSMSCRWSLESNGEKEWSEFCVSPWELWRQFISFWYKQLNSHGFAHVDIIHDSSTTH